MISLHRREYRILIEMLKTKREKKGVTQQQLSVLLGENYNQSVISKIESFERRLDVIELRDYCKAIGISFPVFIRVLDKLLSLSESENPEKSTSPKV